ncbi:hypothetical protein JMUB7518_27910 [Staphylococcus aureus]
MTKIILAADVGGTTCKLGIFTPELEQLHKWSIHTDTSDSTGYTPVSYTHLTLPTN